ncbi:hypothetical protein ACFRIB_34075 [Streptomyces mirabilis]|uniref:hypothetical protein n=1 Tax=Streptomyces mirabilis TaxID=68239 RepID=UPI0036759BD9
MVFAAILLPPGLLCLVLALGRYEEWMLKQPARHAHRRRHLVLVPHTGSQAGQGRREPRGQVTDAA